MALAWVGGAHKPAEEALVLVLQGTSHWVDEGEVPISTAVGNVLGEPKEGPCPFS